jgi:hypothetical protein
LAASKTEAIRLTIARARDRELEAEAEKLGLDRLQQISMDAVWNNPKDDEAGKFYERTYLHGKKK